MSDGGVGDGDGEDHHDDYSTGSPDTGGFPDTGFNPLSHHHHHHHIHNKYPNLSSSKYPTHAHLQKYAPSLRFSSHSQQHDHLHDQQHDQQHDQHHDQQQDYFSKQGYPLQDGYHHSTLSTSQQQQHQQQQPKQQQQRRSTNISQKEYPSQKGFPTYIPEHQDTTYLPDDYGTDNSAQYKKGAPDESVIVRAGQYERRPDNYLCLAIFVTCFCCLPFGLCGVIHASQVKSLWADGEIHDAKAASRLARRWSIAGLIFGALIIVGTVTGFAVRYMWAKWQEDFGEEEPLPEPET